MTTKAMTFGALAVYAFERHTNKIFKYEPRVLKDKDPEDLHQLRVGMRRLRSAIAGFGNGVQLPKTLTEKRIGQMGRILGVQRDNDVLQMILTEKYYPHLPKAEQTLMHRVIKQLKKDRQQAVKATHKLLTQGQFSEFKTAWLAWFAAPQMSVIGELPIAAILPDLLLPQLSEFFLHPGWLIATATDPEALPLGQRSPLDLTAAAIQTVLDHQEPVLHDLRKVAKRTRYQMELFSECYGEDYGELVDRIKQVQEILGNLQDCFVLRNLIEGYLEGDLHRRSPCLDGIFQGDRLHNWHQWRSLQAIFGNLEYRHRCRQCLQHPIF